MSGRSHINLGGMVHDLYVCFLDMQDGFLHSDQLPELTYGDTDIFLAIFTFYAA